MAKPVTEEPDVGRLQATIRNDPVLRRVRDTLQGESAYVVGGTVRDLLMGLPSTDLDLVVEGEVEGLALRLDVEARVHERFGTAEIELDGQTVDLVRARTENYSRPGALPEVLPADLENDLARRDFTINAMAVDLADPERFLDPFDGMSDLRQGILRPLKPDSFKEDPTRVLRAARYAAKFGFSLDRSALEQVPAADLSTVSRDRLLSELERLTAEDAGPEALELLAEWGVGVQVPVIQAGLGSEALRLLTSEPWSGFINPAEFAGDWLLGSVGREYPGLLERPATPSAGLRQVAEYTPGEVLLARSAGADWLDQWLSEWRDARPRITGEDLVSRGVPEGPAIGVGLDAALVAQLDSGVDDFETQMEIALEAAAGGRPGRG